MSLPGAIVAATCIFASAMLIRTRYIAAAIYAAKSPNSFGAGLEHIGKPMVFMAIALFALGVILIILSWFDGVTEHKSRVK